MSDAQTACRFCNGTELDIVLSMGRTPLANALLSRDQLGEPEATYPLDLVFCPNCALVQITETVPPEQLFRDYVYFSSFSDTTLQQSKALVERLIPAYGLDADSRVVEVASNDGYLLQYYRDSGIPVLGIEPAENIARVARERNIPTRCEFFGRDLARALKAEGIGADVIHANNVLAHVADLNGVVEGFSLLLNEGGVVVVEVPYLKDLIDHTEFDTIYHEHLCYFSLTALDRIFSKHGLTIFDVERLAIHGGSLRVFASRETPHRAPGASPAPANDKAERRSDRVVELLAEEARWGVDQLAFYRNFAEQVEHLRAQLVDLLADMKRQGMTLAAYGASAKGSTLLNYFGIGGDVLDFVVDRSTVKQGRYTPGTHLPIYGPERLLQAMPDAVLLLTWNFADEILSQQEEYRRRGGRFVIPIPELKVV